MLSCCFALELKSQKILVMALHPGWVQTDMGGDQVSFQSHTSAPVIVLSINAGGATMKLMLSLTC